MLDALASAFRAERAKVPFFSPCTPWGEQRMGGLLVAVADALPAAERPRFWADCGVRAPPAYLARAMLQGQAAER